MARTAPAVVSLSMTTTHSTRLNPIAGPILGEFLVGMTVAMAGLWLASHTSDAAAGAFSVGNQVLETLFVLFRVLAIGSGIVITQLLGGQQVQAVRRTTLTALAACTWVGVLAVALVSLGNGAILDLLNTPDEVVALAAPYLQVLAVGLMLDAYNLTMASILRAHLQARATLYVMLAMHGTHLLLAAVLMRGVGGWEGLGLYGYAIAYAVSRLLGLVLHLWLWKTRMSLVPVWRDWWACTVRALTPMLRIGVPGAALELGYRIAFLMSLAAAAKHGVAALATQAYTLQLLKYVLLISLAIGWACEIMVGRLIGAGQFDEARKLVRKAVRNGLLASGSLAVLAALGAPWLMRAFTRDPVVIQAAQTLLWISVLLETGRVFNLVLNGVLRSTGDAVYPAAASIGSQLLVLGVGSLVLGRHFGLVGIWFAYAADEWIRGLLMYWRWHKGGWLPFAEATHARMQRKGADSVV
jgi:putative MATE family efflux protein